MDVLVLGGGYAGLLVTKKLERRLPDGVALELIDRTGEHLVQHELHRAIRNPEYVDQITVPLTELTDRATVREARVTAIDRENRTVSLGDGKTRAYDYCVVALGAETAYYDIPGVEAHATPLKRLEHAATIRRKFRGVIDQYSQSNPTTAGRSDRGIVVVGGAGLSGIQVAGELATMAREHDAAAAIDVVLLEQRDSVAPTFPENFQRAAQRALDEHDVDVRTGSTVTAADVAEVTLDHGESIEYDQFIWTGGIRGGEALNGERPTVRGDLRLDSRTFALGDAVRIIDAEGEPVPASAAAAVRATETAATNVIASVEAGDDGFVELKQWNWETPGWLISVGDDAVAQLGPEVFTGPVANAIKSAVGVTYLAEHGSLRRALGVLREEMDDSGEFARFLKNHL